MFISNYLSSLKEYLSSNNDGVLYNQDLKILGIKNVIKDGRLVFVPFDENYNTLPNAEEVGLKLLQHISSWGMQNANDDEFNIVIMELAFAFFKVYYESPFSKNRIDALINMDNFQIVPMLGQQYQNFLGQDSHAVATVSEVTMFDGSVKEKLGIYINLDAIYDKYRITDFSAILKHELIHATDTLVNDLKGHYPYSNEEEKLEYQNHYQNCISKISQIEVSTDNLFFQKNFIRLLTKSQCEILEEKLKNSEIIMSSDIGGSYMEKDVEVQIIDAQCLSEQAQIFYDPKAQQEVERYEVEWFPLYAEYFIEKSKEHGWNSGYSPDLSITEKGTHLIGDFRNSFLEKECEDFIGFYNKKFESFMQSNSLEDELLNDEL